MQSLLSWAILFWIFRTLTTNHNISSNPYTFTKLLWQCECIYVKIVWNKHFYSELNWNVSRLNILIESDEFINITKTSIELPMQINLK